MHLLFLPILLAGALQVDPDTTSAGVQREVERFQKAYLAANSLEPTQEELAAMRALLARGQKEESGRAKEISDKFTASLIANFKLQRDLFRKRGGRVVLSAFGFHVAKDAMAAEWLDWERNGRWSFPNPKVRAEVLRTFSEMRGDGVVEGDKAKEIFARPLWDQARK